MFFFVDESKKEQMTGRSDEREKKDSKNELDANEVNGGSKNEM